MGARKQRQARWLKRRRATWPPLLRGLTAKWITVPVVIITTLAIAFVGYGAITRLSPTRFSRGGPVFQAGAASPSAPGVASGSAGSRPFGRTANAAVPKPPRAARTGASRDRSGGSGGSIPGASSFLPLPATGVYEVHMDGTESVHFGPFSVCSRRLPASAPLDVSKAQGETPTSYVFDLAISGNHTERHIYRYDGNRMFLDFEGARVTCAGVSQTTEISFSPPELRVIAPLKVGASWSGRSGNADRTESYRATVLRTESVTVAGRVVPTYVIETDIDMTGKESGHRLQRWWYAPSLGMSVRWYEQIDASRSGATYSEQATFTVVSLPSG